MLITTEINKCTDCRHLGHSGAFTPGGAKEICSHSDAIERSTSYKGIYKPKNYIKHLNNSKSKQYDAAVNYIHWKHRTIDAEGPIPKWCPLKNGAKY